MTISYKTWPASAKEAKQYAKQIDTTPKDGQLSDADIVKLNDVQRATLYQLADKARSNLIEKNPRKPAAALFFPCQFFPKREIILLNVGMSKALKQNRPEEVVNLESALSGTVGVLSDLLFDDPEFSGMVQGDQCWPTQVGGDSVSVFLVDNFQTFIAELMRQTGQRLPVSFNISDVQADGMTLAFEGNGHVTLVILIDINQIKTTSDLLAVLAHEYVGHIPQYTYQFSYRDDNHVSEVEAFKRSTRFLKNAIVTFEKRLKASPKTDEKYSFIEGYLAKLKVTYKKEQELLAEHIRSAAQVKAKK